MALGEWEGQGTQGGDPQGTIATWGPTEPPQAVDIRAAEAKALYGLVRNRVSQALGVPASLTTLIKVPQPSLLLPSKDGRSGTLDHRSETGQKWTADPVHPTLKSK